MCKTQRSERPDVPIVLSPSLRRQPLHHKADDEGRACSYSCKSFSFDGLLLKSSVTGQACQPGYCCTVSIDSTVQLSSSNEFSNEKNKVEAKQLPSRNQVCIYA